MNLKDIATQLQALWLKDRDTPRTVCPECQFETPEGKPEIHTKDCLED